MIFYDKYIAHWITDTVSLSMLEDGAYNRLIDQYYQSEKALPLDRKMLYRLARANSTPERKAVDFVMAAYFTETPDGYVQPRAEIEIAKYQEKQRKAQASANARWGKSESNANADANASSSHDASDMRTHSDGNASQYPVTSNQNKTLGDGQPVGTPLTRAKPAELSAAMRRHSIEAQPGDPRVIAAADSGISIETVEAACAEAKAAKPDQRINAGYVLTIAERWTREAATPRPTGTAARPGFTNARDESRQRAYQVLTGKTAAPEPEVQPAEVVNGHAKLIR